MRHPAIQMILDMVTAVRDAHNISDEEAFDIVMTWIAVQVHVEEQLSTDAIKIEAMEVFESVFDLNLYKKEKKDWLGSAATELGIVSLVNSSDLAKKIDEEREKQPIEGDMPYATLVENTQAARDIILLHDRMGYGTIYFGTQSDMRIYRMAVLNVHLHRIPAQILYADSSISRALDSQNWRCSNLWNPVPMSKLKKA